LLNDFVYEGLERKNLCKNNDNTTIMSIEQDIKNYTSLTDDQLHDHVFLEGRN